ncbi:DegT/DnrJ/EryC1/StrS family aminotransferase [Candidatus Roizmanbacteria bacterium]|nr:DegT/DnrJ/EryC1/StrS family aminotransferase [Candidatus Roizmanbacteria bacterium]
MQATQKIVFNEVGLRALQQKARLLLCFSSVIDTGQFLQGPENDKLKMSLKKYLNGLYVHLVSSGHDALLLSLISLNLIKTDEIIVPANAYPTSFPVSLSGARMVLCDVDVNGQMSFESLKKMITQNTKAIILVHMYGLVGDIEKIVALAKEKNIILIEDCAQAYGSKFKNKHIGTLGDIGCFSFYPTKNLGTLGDGGAIVTSNKAYSDRVEMLKSYGERSRYASQTIAGHSRLPEIQAGALNIYLESQESNEEKRKQLFLYYLNKIKKAGISIRTFLSHPDSDPVPHLFVIEVKKRDNLQAYLAQHGIETHVHYPHPIHLVPAFHNLGYKEGDFPQAEHLCRNCLSLPFYSFMTEDQVDYIVSKLQAFYG